MDGKTFKSSRLALAIGTSLAVCAALTPGPTHAKASPRAIIGTGADAIIGTGADAIIGTGADAIIGTGADAIIGTGADAIIGTGADAIIGTGADAIIGTGRSKSLSADAIIGTGKGAKQNAIIGTGADAIIGTGADAIIGTGADAIIGTGADAIIGTGADAIIGTGADAIIGTGADAIIGTGKQIVLLMGTVDSFDSASSTIRVLNRNLKLPSTQHVQEAMAAGRQLMVSVTGKIAATGAVDQLRLRFLKSDYVAGASKVVISGRVSEADARTGTMKIGGVTIDYNSAVVGKIPTVGSVVLLVGTQPVRGGSLLAERVFVK